MGCQGSRHENTDAQVIYEEEKKLGYYNKSAKDINIAFHKIHGTDTLTQKQLDFCLKAGELQGFDLGSSNKQDKKLISFYENFYKDKNLKNYDLFRLNIAGVVLSQGDKVEKARLIFENLDRSLSDNLTKQQFLENYAKIAIPLATVWLVQLANHDSQKKVDSSQLWGQVSPMDLIGQQVFEQNDSYKYEAFVSRVEKMENDWFSTFGIREALLKAQNQKNAEKAVKSPEVEKNQEAASTEKKEEKPAK